MALRPLLSTQMATISFSEAGKAVEEAVHFVLGHKEFDLEKNGTFETDDPEVIGSAGEHPWLQVKLSEQAHNESEEQAKAVAESNDPHVNPRADHLSPLADPAVVEAAAKRNAEIQKGAQANSPQVEATEPTATTTQSVSTRPVAPTPPAKTETSNQEQSD